MAERLFPLKVGGRQVVIIEKDDGTATINQDGKELFIIEEIDGSVEVRLAVPQPVEPIDSVIFDPFDGKEVSRTKRGKK